MKRKRPRLKRHWVGLTVRSIRRLRNGFGEIPAGTKFTVKYNYAGLWLVGERCPHCGLLAEVRRVPETDVEIVEE